MAGRNGPCGEFSWPLPTSPGPDVVRHSRCTRAYTTKLAHNADTYIGDTGEMGHAVGSHRLLSPSTPRSVLTGPGVTRRGPRATGQHTGQAAGHENARPLATGDAPAT